MTSSRFFLYEKPWVVLVNQVQMDMVSAIRLRAKAYVIELKYEKLFESDVTENVWTSFRAEGIRPPAVFHRGFEEIVRCELRLRVRWILRVRRPTSVTWRTVRLLVFLRM